MGCCLGALLLAGAPRLALLLWWFVDPGRVQGTFAGWTASIGTPAMPAWLIPVVGLLLLPWLTIAYIWVAPGGITTFEWIVLAIALLFDFGTHGGGGRTYYRRRTSET